MKKQIIVRTICLLLLFAVFFSFVTLNVSANPYAIGAPDVSHARQVYFANIDTGKVIIKKDATSKIAPASTVKIMTGLIALEHFKENLDVPITVTNSMISTVEGTRMNLSAGDTLTVKDLIYGVICGGYNDAAHVLAHAIAGNERDFVSIMNEKADELGAKNTRYANPTGMDNENMYTTLEDTVIIAKAARKEHLYMEISSSVSKEISFINEKAPVTIYNRNSLISSYYSQGYLNKFAHGMISGMTDSGGYCLVTEALIKDTAYLCIVMGADEQNDTIYSYDTANALISFASENLGFLQITAGDMEICELEVASALIKSEKDNSKTITATLKYPVKAYLPKNTDLKNEITYKYYLYPDELTAPIPAGTRIGGVDFYYKGEIIATAPLIIDENIPANEFDLKIKGIRSAIISRKSFITLISFITIFSVWYYFFDHKKRRKNANKIKYKSY